MYSIVFYPFPSFFQYVPSWNVCCFANGAWSSAIVVVLIPKPQKPQIPPPQVTETTERPWKAQLWQLWNANTNPCWTPRWKDHERQSTGMHWKLKHTEAELQVAVQVWLSSHETSTCCNRRLQKSSEDSENLQPSALWDPLLCLLRFPDAPKGLKTRGCLVQCLDVSWCEISRNPFMIFMSIARGS